MRAASLCCILAVASVFPSSEPARAVQKKSIRYAIVIHGGAGGDPSRLNSAERDGRVKSLEAALKVGVAILKKNGSSLDAVEQVIRRLEDDPQFNAGKGAVMNERGGFELDSSIMDGRDRSCGAVAGVTRIKNPISVARLVMTKTRHVLLAGEGADQFAKTLGADRVEQSYFRTDHQTDAWQRRKARQRGKGPVGKGAGKVGPAGAEKLGTVGCAALDANGNLAAGTSTGGLILKRFGRVGDSPIVGAGTFADNATCAVSCTGVGEHYIRNAIAYDVSARMAYKGQTLAQAVDAIITKTLKPGDGGIIAVSKDGEIAMRYNTDGMASAAADSNGKWVVKLK